jgi:hypothetical protein
MIAILPFADLIEADLDKIFLPPNCAKRSG